MLTQVRTAVHDAVSHGYRRLRQVRSHCVHRFTEGIFARFENVILVKQLLAAG